MKDRHSVSNARYVIRPLVVLAVLCTATAGVLAGPKWSTVVSTVGLLGVFGISTYSVLTSIQTVMRRQSGTLTQPEGAQARIEETQRAVSRLSGDMQHLKVRDDGLSAVMQRTLQCLLLAARSVSVPQAHFDQLLRKVSSNTTRTESALDEAVSHMNAEVECATRPRDY